MDKNPEPDHETIRHYLRAWRLHLGLPQTAVQQRLGWPASRLYTIESGRAVLTDSVLKSLARVYGCTIDDLLNRPPPAEKKVEDTGTALQQVLALLARVSRDAQEMRGDLASRIDALENDLQAAAEKIDAAMRESEELRAALHRAAEILTPVRSAFVDADGRKKPTPD